MSYREFYFDLNKLSGRLIKLLRISVIDYEAQPHEFAATLHSHDFYELLFVCDGEGKIYLDGNYFDIKQGHAFIIPPYQEHYEITLPNKSISFRSVAFIGLNEFFLNNLFYDIQSEYDKIVAIIDELFSESECNADNNSLYCQNLAENLIIHLLRKTKVTSDTSPSQENKLFFSIIQIQKYIDNNFNSNLTVENLAVLACLSTDHFIRSFKNLTGQTPRQYIIQKRLDAALTSLTYTDKSVKAICYEIGFSDINNFIRKFKHMTGLAPNEFRDSLKKGKIF